MIFRARLVLVAAILLAAVLVVAKMPVGAIASENAARADSKSELARLTAANRALEAQIRSLGQLSTVATLAHEQYGLVRPGQRAYVVLPSPGEASLAPDPLATNPIQRSQIVPSDALADQAAESLGGSGTAPAGAGTGTFGQVVSHLEFWRWAF